MSDRLPNEIIVEILLRLPVKAIIRFRCVSKTWCSLISSNNFIAIHLNRSLSNPKHPPYLVRHFDYRLRKARLTVHSFDDPFSRNNFTELRSIHKNIDRLKMVLGKSNGLLCLAGGFSSPDCGLYALWNPSIQKFIALPDPNVGIRAHRPFTTSLGFGYVPKADDYKLVRHVCRKRTTGGSHDAIPDWVQIYTLRTRTWRTVMAPGPPFHIEMEKRAAFFNGAVHWPAHVPQQGRVQRNVIVSFNVEDEAFREVGMPKSLQEAWILDFCVAVFDGLLGIVPYHMLLENSVWVMKEYGVVESWTKLFNFDTVNFLHPAILFKPTLRLVEFPFHGRVGSFFLCPYVESLVLLNVEDRVLCSAKAKIRRRLKQVILGLPWRKGQRKDLS